MRLTTHFKKNGLIWHKKNLFMLGNTKMSSDATLTKTKK